MLNYFDLKVLFGTGGKTEQSFLSLSLFIPLSASLSLFCLSLSPLFKYACFCNDESVCLCHYFPSYSHTRESDYCTELP